MDDLLVELDDDTAMHGIRGKCSAQRTRRSFKVAQQVEDRQDTDKLVPVSLTGISGYA